MEFANSIVLKRWGGRKVTVKVYFTNGKAEEYPNAHIYWEWGDDEERTDSGFRINSMDRNFSTAVAFVYPSDYTKIEITSEKCDKVFKSPPVEGLISGKLYRIFAEISLERKRQNEKWGEQNHPMTINIEAPGLFRILADKKKYDNQTDGSEGKAMWANILLEEVYEAFAETDLEKQRAEMIQVAAVAVQIIEYLDRRMEAANAAKKA
jgi:hypothetical protein